MELAEPFDMSQPAISQHLKVLERAGLIARRSDGTKRPCRLAHGSTDQVDPVARDVAQGAHSKL